MMSGETRERGTIMWMNPKEDLLWLLLTQVLRGAIRGVHAFQEDFERLVYQSLI